MAMTPYSGDTSVIGKLGTTPQERGLTTQQFKDKFDEGLKAFVEWFNEAHLSELNKRIVNSVIASDFNPNGFLAVYHGLGVIPKSIVVSVESPTFLVANIFTYDEYYLYLALYNQSGTKITSGTYKVNYVIDLE